MAKHKKPPYEVKARLTASDDTKPFRHDHSTPVTRKPLEKKHQAGVDDWVGSIYKHPEDMECCLPPHGVAVTAHKAPKGQSSIVNTEMMKASKNHEADMRKVAFGRDVKTKPEAKLTRGR